MKKHIFKFSLGDKVKRTIPIRYSKSANIGHVVGRSIKLTDNPVSKNVPREVYDIIWNDNIESNGLYVEFLEKI